MQPLNQPTAIPQIQTTLSPSNLSISATISLSLPPTQISYVPTYAPSLSRSYSPQIGKIASMSRDQMLLIEQSMYALLASNQSQNVLYSYFEDLLYGDTIVIGGASAFSVYLRSELRTLRYQHSVKTISYFYQVSHDMNARFDLKSCSNPKVAGNIVSHLVEYEVDILSNDIPIVYFCGSDKWIMNSCGIEKLLKLCINCIDPCSSRAGNQASAFPSMCPVTGACVNILQVGFDDSFPPAKILSVQPLSISAKHISVNISLSDSFSYVYCMALQSTQREPSLSVLLTQSSQLAVDNALTVSFFDLVPSTSYAIYCITQSQDARVPVSADTLYSVVQTSCCKSILVSITSSYVMSQVLYSAILQLTVSAVPSSYLSIHASIKAIIAPQQNGSSFCSFSSLCLSNTSHTGVKNPYFISLHCSSQKSIGNYSISILISGNSASEFIVDNGEKYLTLNVMSRDLSIFTPPCFESAIYDDSGISLLVQFSTSTNKALLPKLFSCPDLLIFVYVEQASCQWVDSSSLRVTFHGGQSPPVGSSIALSRTDSVRHLSVECPVSFDCASWPKMAANSSVWIQMPSKPVKPKVVVNGPTEIDICSPLEIDLSASYGSAGKHWLNFTVSLSSSTRDGSLHDLLSSIEQFAADSMSKSSYLFVHLPAGLLASATTYSFRFIACNWMGSCGSATYFIAQYNRSSSVPTVSIIGPAVRYINVYHDLTLNGLVQASPCAHSSTTSISWEIYQNGVPLDIQNHSNDSSKYFLPGYTLSVGSTYLVRLLVEEVAGRSAVFSAVVEVIVNGMSSEDLIPIITQGSMLSLSPGKQVTVNGNLSYDRTLYPAMQALDSTLIFSWDCIEKSSNISNSCELLSLLPLGKGRSPSVLIKAGASAAYVGSSYSILLTISKGVSYNQAMITLQIVAFMDDSCAVEIAPLKYGGPNVIIGQKLRISANGVAKASKKLFWSSTDLDLRVASVGVTSRLLNRTAEDSEYHPFTFDLSIAANALLSGITYAVSLSCAPVGNAAGPAAYASIEITPIQPPLSGVFSIIPQSGIELIDVFSMYALQWYSEQLPLYYQFGFKSPGTGFHLLVQPKSEVSYTLRTLPKGELLCMVDVFDFLGSNSSAFSHVSVSSSGENTLSMLDRLTASDLSYSQLSTYSVYLNQANCSTAPNCSRLNRQQCITTDFTCGPCLSPFNGQSGDSNSVCTMPPITSLQRRVLSNASVCSTDRDCGILKLCRGGLCEDLPRDCPNLCSGHGDCSYIQTRTGLPTTSCTYYDSSCSAVCVCANGYAGFACSKSKSQSLHLESIRCSMMRSLLKLIRLSNADTDSIYSWIHLLSSLSFHANEVSSCATTISEVTKYVLRHSAAVHMPYESMQLLSQTFDSLLAANASYYLDTLNLMDQWVSTISLDIVASQSVLSVENRFRYLLVSAYTMDGKVMLDPRSSDEQPMDYVVLNTSLLQKDGWGTYAVIETQAALIQSYEADAASNHITVLVTNMSSSSLMQLEAIDPMIVLENICPVGDGQVVPADNYSTLCHENKLTTHTYNCPASPGPIVVSCNGQAAIINSFCPSRRYSTYCENVIRTENSFQSCSKVTSLLSADQTTCSCKFENVSSFLNARISVAVGLRTELLYTPTTISVIQKTTAKPDSIVSAIFISVLLVIYSVLAVTVWYKKKSLFTLSSKGKDRSKYSATFVPKAEPLWNDMELLGTNHRQAGFLKDIITAAIPDVFLHASKFGAVFSNYRCNSKYGSVIFGDAGAKVRGWVSIMTSWNVTVFFMAVLIAGLSDTKSCNSIHSPRSCAVALSRLYDGDRACEWNSATGSCAAVSIDSGYVTFCKLFRLFLWSSLFNTLVIVLSTHFLLDRHNRKKDSMPGKKLPSQNVFETLSENFDCFIQHSLRSIADAEANHFFRILNKYFTQYHAYKLFLYHKSDVDEIEEDESAFSPEMFADVLQLVSSKTSEELETVRFLPLSEQGSHLFALLMEDLLPATSAAIVGAKRMRDRFTAVPFRVSSVRSALLIVINVVSFVTFGVLLSLESYGEQILLLYSFLLWIVVDGLLIDWTYVLIGDVLVPSVAAEDLSAVVDSIQSAVVEPYISSIAEKIHSKHRTAPATIFVPSVARIFMPSVLLASLLPNLREARMIRAFRIERSMLQGIFQVSNFKSKDLSMWARAKRLFTLLSKSFFHFELHLQDFMIRLVCVGLSAALIYSCSALFYVSPILVVIPIALTLFAIYVVPYEGVKIRMHLGESFNDLLDGANLSPGLGQPWMKKLSSELYVFRTAEGVEKSIAHTSISKSIVPIKALSKPISVSGKVLPTLDELKEDAEFSSDDDGDDDDTDSSFAAEESLQEEIASHHISFQIDSSGSNSTVSPLASRNHSFSSDSEKASGNLVTHSTLAYLEKNVQDLSVSAIATKEETIKADTSNEEKEGWFTFVAQKVQAEPFMDNNRQSDSNVEREAHAAVADISMYDQRKVDYDEQSIAAISLQTEDIGKYSPNAHGALASLRKRNNIRTSTLAWSSTRLGIRSASISPGESLTMMPVPRLDHARISWSPRKGEDYLVHPSPEAVEFVHGAMLPPLPLSPVQLSKTSTAASRKTTRASVFPLKTAKVGSIPESANVHPAMDRPRSWMTSPIKKIEKEKDAQIDEQLFLADLDFDS